MTTRLAGLAAALSSLVLVPAAHAGTVSVQGDEIVFLGGEGENRLDLSGPVARFEGERAYSVRDRGEVLTPGPGCQPDGDEYGAVCVLPDDRAATRFRADMGPGTDLARVDAQSETPADLLGGDGFDFLVGGAGADRLDGGPGPDRLAGDEGLGATGAGLRRPDELIGGPDRDQAVYDKHGAPRIVVTLDDRPDDGAEGEGDNVHADVEDVFGDFEAENVLTGTDGPNLLVGGRLNDTLTGGGGPDQLSGERGDDVLEARDGVADAVQCEDGVDRAVVDAQDTLEGCETVDAPPPPEPTPTPTPSPTATPTPTPTPVEPLHGTFPVKVLPRSVRMTKRGKVRLRLRCEDSAGCSGRLFVTSLRRVRIGGRRRLLDVGRATFVLPAGATRRLTFQLSRPERRGLVRLRRLRVLARAVERRGRRRDTQREVTLRRP